ncbi:MAG: glycosyl transferase [Alistipes sp.]|nr:glycosyl transferase [Alistipes sp.]
MIKKIFDCLIHNPRKLVAAGLVRIAKLFPDELYLKLLFRLRMGYKLNLDNPQTFCEKLQWLKLHNRKPEYTQMVDKYDAKRYVADIIGEEYIIPTIGVWDRVEDIDFDKLPNQFVLKCTHDSGGIVICKDKSQLDIAATKKLLRRGLKKNYYWQNREWPYKNITPRIICEQYMVDESGYELKDYKWFCFDGVAKALFIATDRGVKGEETKFDFYDTEFNHLPFTNGHPNASKEIKKPAGFEQMKQLASQLSKGQPHLRVDFYDINGKIYFGELTFYHWSGTMPFDPMEWDYTFGSWINLDI